MLFNIKIKNLGKLSAAEIRLGKFTVFAGPNNTGKSYVSKALYSIFGAMNANHLAVAIRNDIGYLRSFLVRIERFTDFQIDSLKEMLSAVVSLHDITSNISGNAEADEFAAIQNSLPDISKKVKNINQIAPRLRKELQDIKDSTPASEFEDGPDIVHMIDEDDLERMMKCAKTLQEIIGESTETIIAEGLKSEVRDNFLNNFQVSRLSDLYNGEDGAEFYISGVGEITAYNADKVKFMLQKAGLDQLQKFSRVLYLESPFYWRMKSPLGNVRNAPRFRYSSREELDGVPKYAYDMYGNLERKYTGEMICPGVFEKLTKEVLGGKLVVSETGELLFQEGENAFPLHLAAVGVANLGMLALLIERNLLDKDTFLFVDEPEAHLHPAWQVAMAEALYELSKEGVNVVIATHSPDMLKWLEELLNKKPQAESNIEVNRFRGDGTAPSNGESVMDRLNAVQEELADPFFTLHHQGL